MTIRSLATIAAALVATATPALADDAPTTVVSYRDLNLATTQGVAALNHRIASAITTMCGEAGSRDLSQVMAVSHCRNVAKSSAAPQVAILIDHAQRVAQGDTGTLRIASR